MRLMIYPLMLVMSCAHRPQHYAASNMLQMCQNLQPDGSCDKGFVLAAKLTGPAYVQLTEEYQYIPPGDTMTVSTYADITDPGKSPSINIIVYPEGAAEALNGRTAIDTYHGCTYWYVHHMWKQQMPYAEGIFCGYINFNSSSLGPGQPRCRGIDNNNGGCDD